jgi:P27 family predicted phage terminase small subunit
MGSKRAPSAPDTLGAEGSKLWRTLGKRYAWRDEQLCLVAILCQTLDRIEEGRAAIQKDGAYSRTEGGMVRAHPALKAEKDAKTSFTSAWKALGLDLVELPESEGGHGLSK